MEQLTIRTPLGNMLAKANEVGICSLSFIETDDVFCSKTHLLLQLNIELDEYFDGKRQCFTSPLSILGTPFQMRVWNALRQIQYGKTVSYTNEAAMLDHHTAVRAVANANAKNPIAILIPCHRVIASSGSIGGYNSGVWRKAFLLNLEAKYY